MKQLVLAGMRIVVYSPTWTKKLACKTYNLGRFGRKANGGGRWRLRVDFAATQRHAHSKRKRRRYGSEHFGVKPPFYATGISPHGSQYS